MTSEGLAAAAPAYVKAHSFGEFVFDFSWAQAYAQHGLAYYPKLVLGVPFTPASGARLLVRPDLDAAKMRALLIAAIREFAAARDCSSIHGLFVADADREAMAQATAGSRATTCSSTGTTADTAISITTWKASPPTNARRQNANAGASLEDGSHLRNLVRHRPRSRSPSTRCTTCIATRSCGTAMSPI